MVTGECFLLVFVLTFESFVTLSLSCPIEKGNDGHLESIQGEPTTLASGQLALFSSERQPLHFTLQNY